MTARLPNTCPQPSSPQTDPEIAALRAELAAHRALLETLLAEVRALRPPPPPPADARFDALVHAIVAHYGAEEFTAPWLFDAAGDIVATAAPLTTAILAIVGRDRPKGAHKRLARVLSRAAKSGTVTHDGLRLVRAPGVRHRDGLRYRVACVDNAR